MARVLTAGANIALTTGSGTLTVSSPDEIIDASTYGVTADGSTDDTAAWGAAVAAASVAGVPLVAPPGTSITSGFDLPAGLILVGHRMGSTIKAKSASTRAVLGIQSATTTGVTIRGLTIDGDKANQTDAAVHGLLLDNASTGLTAISGYTPDAHHLVEDVYVRNCEGSGVVVTGRGDSHFVRVKSHGNELNGFDINGFDLWFTDCIAGSNGAHGFENVSGNNTFSGCKAFLSGEDDFHVGPHSYFGRYEGCVSQGAYGNGFYLDAGSRMNIVDITVVDADYGAAGLTSAVVLDNAPSNTITAAVGDNEGSGAAVYGVNFLTASAGTRINIVGFPAHFSGGLVGGDTTGAEINPPGAGDAIWISASGMMSAGGGAPSYNAFGWLLDEATVERLSFTLPNLAFPAHWSTYDVELYWTNAGAGSGNVLFYWTDLDASTTGADDGDTLSATFDVQQLLAAPAQNVLSIDTIASDRPVGSGDYYWFRIDRQATDGTDTLANDCQVLGVKLIRNS